MRKSRFTENEMVRAVKRLESGMNAEEISRELGISRITLYKWKSKYSGMEELVYEYDISISRACRLMNIYRSYFYYRSRKDDAPIEKASRKGEEPLGGARDAEHYVVTGLRERQDGERKDLPRAQHYR